MVGFIVSFQSYVIYMIGRVFFSIQISQNKSGVIQKAKIASILVVRLDGLGDLVMTSGFLRVLRRHYPNARISLVVKQEFYNMVENCPYTDDVFTFETKGLRFLRPLLLPYRAIIFARKTLTDPKYDLLINPRWDVDGFYASIISYFANAKWRLTYSESVNPRKQYFNKRFNSFYTHVIDNRAPKHEVERNLDLIRFLDGNPDDGVTEVWLSDEDRLYADSTLRKFKISENELLIAIAPGAGHKRRMWSLDNYINIILWLKQRFDVKVIIIGGNQEVELCNSIVQRSGESVYNMAGKTTLRGTCAILERCNLFVGNDSGPLHMAVSVGIPVVEISCHPRFGSDLDAHSPVRFGPWTSNKAVLQPANPMMPCNTRCDKRVAHCINSVLVQDVKNVIETLIPSMNKI